MAMGGGEWRRVRKSVVEIGFVEWVARFTTYPPKFEPKISTIDGEVICHQNFNVRTLFLIPHCPVIALHKVYK